MHALENKRILITRSRHQSSEMATRLNALGAVPILIPTIEIVPPESFDSLDSALSKLDIFDWLIFTSPNAVEVFAQRYKPSLVRAKIAVIGPATAQAVQGKGLQVDLIPPRYIGESLAESLVPDVAGKRILLIRAAEARDVVPEVLTRAGAVVIIAEAYRNCMSTESIPALRRLFESTTNLPDAITFTSASTARNLIRLLEAANLTLPGSMALASIGPITSKTLRDLGLAPHLEASEPTIPALIQALADYFAKNLAEPTRYCS